MINVNMNGRLERIRYIKQGRIRPPYAMPPQLMVRDGNGWKPGIGEVEVLRESLLPEDEQFEVML